MKLSRKGIEPLCQKLQTCALPLSYPDKKIINNLTIFISLKENKYKINYLFIYNLWRLWNLNPYS